MGGWDMNTARDLPKIINEIQKGLISFVAGDNSSGKTALAIQLLVEFGIERNKKVLFLSTEQNKEAILARILSLITNIELLKILSKQINQNEYEKLCDVTKEISNSSIYINKNDNISAKTLLKELETLKQTNINLDVIIIDGINSATSWDEYSHKNLKKILLNNKTKLIMFGIESFTLSDLVDKRIYINRNGSDVSFYTKENSNKHDICKLSFINTLASLA